MILDLLAAPWWKPLDEPTQFIQGYRWSCLAFVLALLITLFLTPNVRRLAFKFGAVDDPKRDDRRVHMEPLARWGGIAIAGGILGSTAVVMPLSIPNNPFPPYLVGLLLMGMVLVFVGVLDDLLQFSARSQLYLLLAAGAGLQFFRDNDGQIQIYSLGLPGLPVVSLVPTWVAFIVTALYLFFITKTMDTIDGIDGLASGLAFVAAAAICVMATIGGQPLVAQTAAAIAGASLGFLKHNYHPSTIIMGTSGAYVLGFMLAGLSVIGAIQPAPEFSLITPFLIFGVPLFDAFFVIFRRLKAGVPIYQADKRHTHHTLLRMGLSQRQTVWVLYAISAVLSTILVMIVTRTNA